MAYKSSKKHRKPNKKLSRKGGRLPSPPPPTPSPRSSTSSSSVASVPPPPPPPDPNTGFYAELRSFDRTMYSDLLAFGVDQLNTRSPERVQRYTDKLNALQNFVSTNGKFTYLL